MSTIPVSSTACPLPNHDGNRRSTNYRPAAPGNPFARQVAQLRKRLLDRLTGEELDAIADKLIEESKDGNVPATKLLFSYTLGKPAEAVQPDRLDIEEWNAFRATAGMAGELPGIMATPDPSFPLEVVRAARPGVARDLGRELGQTLRAGEEREQRRQRRREERRQQRGVRRAAQGNASAHRPKQHSAHVAARTPLPQSPADAVAQQRLEEVARLDGEALSALSSTGVSCPPVALAPPSTNGCQQTPAPMDETVPPHNGRRPAGGLFGRLWPFSQRGS
jgi:hypothetical protein